jgi:lipopolysaccharide transport system ATP-binding protein
MSETIIHVENLGKKYIIGHQKAERYVALRDVIANGARSLSRRLLQSKQEKQNTTHEEFWALKDVSFEVKQGDRVGIIGRNGAGKSTLLKILSRITEPTTGSIRIRGRVASLLEVGTGFHPELTGRENIYLNGAILGMSRREIRRKFDEIVAFAEVEKFLDTPVKRYSSGMYVRLAFAVAAHLEPEILIVDEVLAVGDAAFQKKCLGKMEDVATNEGRTVLFVSHNMAAIKKLCRQAAYFQQGRLNAWGNVESISMLYESEIFSDQKSNSHLFPITNRIYKLTLERCDVNLIQEENHAHLNIDLFINSENKLKNLGIAVQINTYDGFIVSKLGASITGNIVDIFQGLQTLRLRIPNIETYLNSGDYSLSIELVIPRIQKIISVDNITSFHIPAFDIYETGIPCESIKHGLVPLPIKIA